MGLFKYPWLLGKILALAFIFIGGGILATSIVPVVLLVKRGRQERTQELVRLMFRFYLWLLCATRIIDLHVEDGEKFAACKGKLVIANHPSLLDVVVLIALIPRAQCIIKHELWSHRFLGCLMRSAGYIRNDLEPEALMASCKAALQEGRCIIVFPEGTRTKPGQMPQFQRGFATIAYLAEAAIQTVVISCDPLILYKGEPLWQAPSGRPVFRFKLGECLDKDFYVLYAHRGVAVRAIVKHLEAYYRKMIQNGQAGA